MDLDTVPTPTVPPLASYVVGDLELHRDRQELTGSRGHVLLRGAVFAVAEMLMRAPGQVVPAAALAQALRSHLINVEPGGSPDFVRQRVKEFRAATQALSVGRVQVRGSDADGYEARLKPRRGSAVGSRVS